MEQEGAEVPVPEATPTEPGTEMSFSTSSPWQWGQTGGGASRFKTIFSNLMPQFLQWYSKMGIALLPTQRTFSRMLLSAALERAPTCCWATWPPLKIRSDGMAMIP